MYFAEELVSAGGPSAPAWAFFTAITLALIGLYGQQIAAKREAKSSREEATKAHKSAAQAEANTVNVSNGFVNRMDRKLDTLNEQQYALLEWQREHQEWHMRAANERNTQ